MTVTEDVLKKLPTQPEQIEDTAECIQIMQQLIRTQVPNDDVETLMLYLIAIIKKETVLQTANGFAPNQTVLNLAFRVYYQIIGRSQKIDHQFQDITTGISLKYNNDVSFQMLFSILQTDHVRELNSEKLKDSCVQALINAIEKNSNTLLAITKALNLLINKFADLVVSIKLEHIYHCMQSNQQGVREETLVLFNHCCKDHNVAFANFHVILTFWPWTNRNKYYLLSAILNKHKLRELLPAGETSESEFFAGLRSSLSYKSLLAASQYLVSALSKQHSVALLETAIDIFITGTIPELQNFYSQWYGRITQKDELFNLIKTKNEVISLLQDAANSSDCIQHLRLILIFGMFSKQIFELSKLHFFKLSTELITNCFQYKTDAQLLIFRFVVDNLNNFAIEDCLDFLLSFIKTHIDIESSQFRNTILGKMPNIINYVAKYYCKMRTMECSSLKESVLSYFQKLQLLIETNVGSEVYQPKIFSLKLLEILLRSLYIKDVQRNAKNCCITHNQVLGQFLIDQHIFDAKAMYHKLFKLLNQAEGYDDALDVIVNLLELLGEHASMECYELTRHFCMQTDIDACVLSGLYAKVSMHSKLANEEHTLELLAFCIKSLESSVNMFQADPMLKCANENQLFGHLLVINEIFKTYPMLISCFATILELLQTITSTVLQMLNLWNVRNNQNNSAASFQDMDKSLQLLVSESAIKRDNHEAARKFLLLSFWFTLKAACELSTTIGCILVATSAGNDEHWVQLDKCINLNIAVLTKCRHKGAIEAAGVCIGELTKCITSKLKASDKPQLRLKDCLELLFDNEKKQVSTTRRGAGFSIMLLHIIKNEDQRRRPLLKATIDNIMNKLKASKTVKESTNENVDRMEALTLHYLCVLVKDTELREAMLPYQNEIMLAAIENIDHTDWTICNAALQLFGAVMPKIVGQRQATEFDIPNDWDTTELTYDEILRKLPYICEYILIYCGKECFKSTSIRSIILFVGFLSNVEYLRKTSDESIPKSVLEYRELMWRLLAHHCEKVRNLAAIAFVRLHDFQIELPIVLFEIAQIIFNIRNVNFFEGLIFVLSYGLMKLESDSIHTSAACNYNRFLVKIRSEISNNLKLNNFKPYALFKLLELLIKLDLDKNDDIVRKVRQVNIASNTIGYDLWIQKVACFKK